MTNLTFVASLAYKAVAVQLALSEANWTAHQLNLPTPHPIQMTDVTKAFAASPKFRILGVTIETTNFIFNFRVNQRPTLFRIVNKAINNESVDLYDVWAKTPSLITSNQAYQLATQWLAAIDVDVGMLERKYGSQRQIGQAFFWNQPAPDPYHRPPGDTNKTMLPIFNVTWGHGVEDPHAAQVRILGTTKELLDLVIGEPSISRRPLLVITNAMELNNTDPPVIRHLRRPAASQTNSSGSVFTNASPILQSSSRSLRQAFEPIPLRPDQA